MPKLSEILAGKSSAMKSISDFATDTANSASELVSAG